MRILSLVPLPVVLILGSSAHPHPRHIPRSLAEFEERFIDSLPYTSNDTVRLVGFKNIAVPEDEARAFESAWLSRPADWNTRGELSHVSHFYYLPETRTLRLYFPVEGALLSHDDALVEADHLGQLPVGEVRGDCRVVGRKQTDSVHGVHGNDVRDGIVFLAAPAAPVRQVGRTYVYDFGRKSVHGHHGRKRDEGDEENDAEDSKKGCLANHGGKNCSKVYGISKGRCKMDPKTCMDYNGPVTDCKKGTTTVFGIPTVTKIVKFVGSDCSVSVAKGHCWNELM